MKLTYLDLGIWLSAIALTVCAALLVAKLLIEHEQASIEVQCRHMNKYHFNGEYGPCPNDPGLAVYRRGDL